MSKKILITGGAGFIGCHVIQQFVESYPDYTIVNLDALTYAGNLENLSGIENFSNYIFEKGDISDSKFIDQLFDKYQFDGVINLAAESHVDRSISDPMTFIQTNIVGLVNLLNASKRIWDGNYEGKRFYQISTDEVYGALEEEGMFTEETPYDPQSPYSASKASCDHFVRAYANTYGMPILISNCSNNYGPNQFPEKLIPLVINNIKKHKPIPIYGLGLNIRDWLHVKDHATAIDLIFHRGKEGETYNIGGNVELTNIDLVKQICSIMDHRLGQEKGTAEKLIIFVKDREGHDLRYAIDALKIKNELHWAPSVPFKEGLTKTVDWYLKHEKWMENIINGEYQNYYKQQYSER